MPLDFELHVAPDGDVLAAARACELDVFVRAYGESPQIWYDDWAPYEDQSLFLAVTESGGDVVAAMRIIVPGSLSLKTITEVGKSPWFIDGYRSAQSVGLDLDHTWDISTLAVHHAVRRSNMVPVALYHAMFHAARRNDAQWVVMIIDSRVRRVLNMLSIRAQAMPGTSAMPYYGSDSSVPLWGNLSAMADWQRRNAPEAHRLVNLGIGLDNVKLPPVDQYDLDGIRARRARIQLATISAESGSERVSR